VVRGLVYQPSGPGSDSWHVSFRVSYYKGKNPNDAAATYLIFVNYILCTNLLAGFLARDCYEGIRTWDLWVSVLIESYRRAMVGGTPEFPGQLIASLLVAQWSKRWCTSLVAQGSIPGMSRSESPITRGKTQMMLLPPTSFS
jgi:hypothetical protein